MKLITKDVDFATEYCEVVSVKVEISKQLEKDIGKARQILEMHPILKKVTVATYNGNPNYFGIECYDASFDDEETPAPADWRPGWEGIEVTKFSAYYKAYNKYNSDEYIEVNF